MNVKRTALVLVNLSGQYVLVKKHIARVGASVFVGVRQLAAFVNVLYASLGQFLKDHIEIMLNRTLKKEGSKYEK